MAVASRKITSTILTPMELETQDSLLGNGSSFSRHSIHTVAHHQAQTQHRQWFIFWQTPNTCSGYPLGRNSTQAMVHLLANTQWLTFRQKLNTGSGSPFVTNSTQAMAHLLAQTQHRQWLTFWQTLSDSPLGTNSTQEMAHL